MFGKIETSYLEEMAKETDGVFAIPNWLFDEHRYASLSNDARILYAMLLYRRNPAILKGYAVIGETLPIETTFNKSVDTVKYMLSCGNKKAKKIIAELIDGNLVTAEAVIEK
jgi:hypothetical protein